MKTVVFIPFDQLDRRRGALREACPATHEILMIESDDLLGARAWHAQRLFFIMSAAAHFREDLEVEGFTVHLMHSPSIAAGLAEFRAEHPGRSILAAQGSSHAQQRLFESAGIDVVPNDFFLTSREEFTGWAGGRATLLMETFYRWQRQRLGILLDDRGEPVGGQWNFDADNRLPPPKGHHPWPAALEHPADATDERVWSLLKERELSLVGSAPDGTWATTRAGALEQLEHFLETGFAEFG
ncbi:MAG: cryptochrome/photolyase family protein, partial [Alphaproteobacteria bacterium]|nr:cryptochrome/photolyase family protein [Alphaproteobacteria bacterium]